MTLQNNRKNSYQAYLHTAAARRNSLRQLAYRDDPCFLGLSVCLCVCVCVCERMEGDKGDKVSKLTKLNRVYRYQASFLLFKIEIQFCRRALLLLLLLEESKCSTVEILGKQQSIYICTRAMLRLGPSWSGVGSGSWCGR